MEGSESSAAAVVREIKEELSCLLDSVKLSYLKTHFEKDSSITTHIFHYPVTDELCQAVLKEGQAFQFMALTDLVERNVVPRHWTILEWYFQRIAGQLYQEKSHDQS